MQIGTRSCSCRWQQLVAEQASPDSPLAVAKTTRGFHSLAHLAPFEIKLQMSSLTNQGLAQMLQFIPKSSSPHQNRIMYSNFELHLVQWLETKVCQTSENYCTHTHTQSPPAKRKAKRPYEVKENNNSKSKRVKIR